jgi:iron complex transport system substrate-binding protein
LRRSGARAPAVLALLPFFLLTGLTAGCRSEPAAFHIPQRIVSLAPSLTETLFALGLGPRVVGVGDYDHFPPEARSRPHLGGLFNPNLERMVALKPDLAVLLPSQNDLGDKLGRLGVASLVVRNESLADVENGFRTIADRCGVPETGRRLAADLHRDLASRPPLKPGEKPREKPGEKPLQVVLSVGRQAGRLTDLLVAGPGTFYDELLSRLGARNAFADAPVRYPQVALEEVLTRRPDVILEIREDLPSPEVARQLTSDWWGLPQLQAASRARVFVLAGDYVVVPGPRLPRLYREMGAVLDAADAARAARSNAAIGQP